MPSPTRGCRSARASFLALLLATTPTLSLPGCSDPQAGTIQLNKGQAEIEQEIDSAANPGRKAVKARPGSGPETLQNR
jgi:hypothetical protein